ncbi:MAG TPA: hypothetical protein EYQ61_05825 [Dehalococcoidia bacterium]|nr:hypothetical protein [Dehalococcoidia bacterium]
MPEIEQADGSSVATEQAEERTRETRGFMRSVRRATRRKYTPEEEDPDSAGGVSPGSDRL